MFFILASIHLIGIQPWCTFDSKTQSMQCNYENRDACEGYRESSEICLTNPNKQR